ncbi:MAG: hypothetical protein D6814_00595 [Calditrichaeota bacterium]|nr:MAG: hypothetical protein D6814_00595 [Calditrichota bacterium]
MKLRKILRATWWIGSIILISAPVYAQGFGKNKIQYHAYNWKFIQTEHYDIYFYGDGLPAAKFAAAVAESSYKQISGLLDFEMQARTPILIYNSHNDFEETTISPQIQEESVGGFTEFLKNRVVLPYEGSAEQFRHVIHHELFHALHLQYFYGAGPGAIIQGISGFAIPGWIEEGSAEYFSMHWDTQSDNFIRDAVISGYLPPIGQLYGFMAYKGGQALNYWIERRYGVEKISQLNASLRHRKNVDRAFRAVFGMSVEELSNKWHQDLKKEYWPEISRRKAPDELALPITDHRKNVNFVNNGPSLSPKGDKIAFLSDQSGKFDIYLASTLAHAKPRKLISGQKQSGLEELKWLRPGITWSPDGRKIAFAAKAGDHDAIHIVDIKKKKIIKTFKPNFDGIWSPAWSPDGRHIAFMAAMSGKSDIMLLDIYSGNITNVTNDPFSDLEPSWSPDGKWIAFTSDRGAFKQPVKDILPLGNFANTDIFIIKPDGSDLQQLTFGQYAEKFPVFYHSSDSLLYISDENGIDNIFFLDRTTGKSKPLTNLLSGANQITTSVEGDRIAYTSFYRGGYDIYLWKTPFQDVDSLITLEPTPFRLREQKKKPAQLTEKTESKPKPKFNESERPFRKFIFDEAFREGKISNGRLNQEPVEISKSERMAQNGEFKIHHYKPKFSVDWIGAAGGYDPFFGVSGFTQLILSDLMGNQQIGIGLNIVRDIQNSDIVLSWNYLPRRTDIGVQLFHFAYFFQTNLGIERLRHLGAQAFFYYPLSRFKRLEFMFNLTQIREQNLIFNFPQQITTAVPLTLAYVSDNSFFRFFGPFSGTRYRFSLIWAPPVRNSYLSFQTAMLDYRTYLPLSREIGFALRFSGGVSGGPDPMQFILGGVENWINPRFAQNLDRVDITNFFFSSFAFPLRGADYYERVGRHFFLINAELRFPLVDYFIVRFPLPMGFANIRGAGFMDIGSAWNSNKRFRATYINAQGKRALRDIVASFGWGFRANLGIFLLRMDTAWRTDLATTSKPHYIFSLGTDF